MPACPDCGSELVEGKAVEGSAWLCEQCGARVEDAGGLRQLLGEEGCQALLRSSSAAIGARRRPCSVCAGYATEVRVVWHGADLVLEFCPICRSGFFSSAASREIAAARELAAPPTPSPEAPAIAAPFTSTGQTAPPAPPVPQSAAGERRLSQTAPVLTEAQQERLAAFYAASVAQQMNRKLSPENKVPWWKWILLLFGIPVRVRPRR